VIKPDIVYLGDSTIVVEFEARIDPLVNERVIRLADRIRAAKLVGVRDVVPTFRSVAVHFDPLRTPFEELILRLEQGTEVDDHPEPADRAPLSVPVCYGGEFGPDLEHVAAHARLTPDEVIERHASTTYRVFMLGFLPGFAYMGLVDHRIAAPRHSTPRLRVARGSVGIAGRQTGVYSAETPGGWQILGRTPIRTFDLGRPSPFFFSAGDRVRFIPISVPEYEKLLENERGQAVQGLESTGGDIA
jgi:inhibitor of KinA